MFAGYSILDGSFQGLLITFLAGVPAAPDAPPTFTVYNPAGGAMSGGTGSCGKFLGDAGLYQFDIATLGSSGYEIGSTYTVVFRFAFSSAAHMSAQSFIVS